MAADKNKFETSDFGSKKNEYSGNRRNGKYVKKAAVESGTAQNAKTASADKGASYRKNPKNNRRGGKGRSSGYGNSYGNNRGGAQGAVRARDGLGDIRTSGGHYVKVDYEELEYGEKSAYDSSYNDVRDDRSRDGSRNSEALPGAVVGRNAVRELLKSNRSVDKIYVKTGDREGSITVLVAEAVSRGIPVIEVDSQKLDRMAGGSNHQGVIAAASEKEYTDVDGILRIAKERGETPLIVIADGVEDPHNLGAIIRCAECSGAHGIIIPKRRAVGLTPTVAKASAGAIEHMAIAKVNNINQTIDKLKKNGIWIFAAEAGGTPYYDIDFSVPAAIVLGSEGAGVSRLIKEQSDFIASIPMYGKVNSLNVSTAAAVLLCHAARMQRGNSK